MKFRENILSFLNENRIKVSALGMSLVMLGSLSACKDEKDIPEITTTTSISEENSKALNIINNIENISVTKDEENSTYFITERVTSTDKENITSKDGDVYMSLESSASYTKKYYITFTEAEELGITEILEEKLEKVYKK